MVDKKKKSSKKKKANILFKLVSTAKTGFYYIAFRNPKKRPDKMKFKKYDPKVRKHVEFVEAKHVMT